MQQFYKMFVKKQKQHFRLFVAGDRNGQRSGKPRFKNQSRYPSLTFPNADDSWLKFSSINGKWLYISIPKTGLIKVRPQDNYGEELDSELGLTSLFSSQIIGI